MINLEIFKHRDFRPFERFRESAVLLLVQTVGDEKFLILEKRAMSMRSQPGDISFPGGRLEPGEEPAQAALRETAEETGLAAHQIELIGALEFYVTHFGAILYPFVGRTNSESFKPNPDEVEHLIRIPLEELLAQEPEIYSRKIDPTPPDDFPYDRIQGGRNYNFSSIRVDEYFYQYKDYHIWGTTAKILHHFLNILKTSKDWEEPLTNS